MGTILAIVLCYLASEVTEPGDLPDGSSGQQPTAAVEHGAAPETGHAPKVLPASETQFAPKPLVPIHRPPRSTSSAVSLVKEAMTPPENGRLDGRELSLYDLLATAPVQSGYQQRIHRYWQLATATARYRWAAGLQARLASLQPEFADDLSGQEATARWQAALAATRVDIQQARLAAIAAQYGLADLRPTFSQQGLPLPVDLPHAGQYRTRYNEIFQGQPVVAAYRIDQTLPPRYDLLGALAESVETAEVCFDQALSRIESSHDPSVDIRRECRTLARQRTLFLEAVLSYNSAISDYALLVAPPGMPPARLVAMLIPSDAGPIAQSPTPRFAAEDDGLTSVLKRRPSAPRLATPGGSTGVVPATAETPIEPPQTAPPGNAQPPAQPNRDSFVPRRPGLDP